MVSLGGTPELPNGLRALHVNLAGVAPVVSELAPRPGAPVPAGPLTLRGSDPWTEWCEGAEDMLRWLV